jgi:DNA polymerase III epsilon subunit-like protein
MSFHTATFEPATRLRPLLFLDFEASALTPGSWPVEIGYAWIDRGRVHSRASLIAPRPEWSMDDWSDAAAHVHGIARADLAAAAPADDVAAETDAFADFDVVSDNPRWEQIWLDRLRTGRDRRIEVRPLARVIAERLDEDAASTLACALFRSDPPHRAGDDAERLATAWAAATTLRAHAA